MMSLVGDTAIRMRGSIDSNCGSDRDPREDFARRGLRLFTISFPNFWPVDLPNRLQTLSQIRFGETRQKVGET